MERVFVEWKVHLGQIVLVPELSCKLTGRHQDAEQYQDTERYLDTERHQNMEHFNEEWNYVNDKKLHHNWITDSDCDLPV